MPPAPGNDINSGPSTRFTAYLVLICVSILTVWGAATRGPITIDPPSWGEPVDPPDITYEIPIDEIEDESVFELPDQVDSTPLDLSGFFEVLKWLGVILLAAAVVIVVLRIIAELRRTIDHGEESAQGRVHATAPSELNPDLSALETAVQAAQSHLDADLSPSDAIIAAWVAIEEAAGHSGLAKEPWHTTSEFTVWVLSHAELDHQALNELMELYHSARFSSHTHGPAQVAQARDLLNRIQASWSVA